MRGPSNMKLASNFAPTVFSARRRLAQLAAETCCSNASPGFSCLAVSSRVSAPQRRHLKNSASSSGSARPPSFTRYSMSTPSPDPGRGAASVGEIFSEGGGTAGERPRIRTRTRTAYIALGSNMGDRIAMIEEACNRMDARGIRVRRTSSLWETEPMYVLDQDKFVNGVCEVETELEPLALLDQLQDIELGMGRKKLVDKGPRNIDLDILLYGDEKVDHERLRIPHVGIPEREFVLRPLTELIPNKPIDLSRPWKLAQDYLNELPLSHPPLTTLTRLSADHPPIQALRPARRTHVMAILNLTPDSFSDGGRHDPADLTRLRELAASFVEQGATMIDVGGQSTAPGAAEVSAEEEIRRVVPAVEAIRAATAATAAAPDQGGKWGQDDRGWVRPLISVDTYRAAVAEAAVAAGADMINDISAGAMDPEMLPTAARLGVAVVLTHMRGTPATMDSLSDYGSTTPPYGSSSSPPPSSSDPDSEPEADDGGGGGDTTAATTATMMIPTLAAELLSRVRAAEEAGVRRWRIVLDPGLGFAKRGARQNLEVLRRLGELRAWPGLEGIPWLVGPSRKRFVGAVTGVRDPAGRAWGTAAAVAAAVQGGADVVRVHDVAAMSQAVAVSDAIWRV